MLITLFLCLVKSSNDIDQKTALIKLTSKQQSDIERVLVTLLPKFILTTYLVDPVNLNTCYLFIENTESNEINYFDIRLDDKTSLDNFKDEVLIKKNSVNDIFKLNFQDVINIQFKIEIMKNISASYNFIKFNKFLKRIVIMFSLFLIKLDLSFKNKIMFIEKVSSSSKKVNITVCEYISEFLKFNYDFKKNLRNTLSISNSNIIKDLEIYILHRLSCYNYFYVLGLMSKFNYITQLSKTSYLFCQRHQIPKEQLIEILLEKFYSIENKLDKYTFVLCFIKINNDKRNFHCKPRLLKLIIFLILYIKIVNYNLNNEESLLLLYMIGTKRILDFDKMIQRFRICVLNKNQEDDMKIIIIRRYSYFIVFNRNIYFDVLTNVKCFSDYFYLTWLIIKCCSMTIYKILNIELS